MVSKNSKVDSVTSCHLRLYASVENAFGRCMFSVQVFPNSSLTVIVRSVSASFTFTLKKWVNDSVMNDGIEEMLALLNRGTDNAAI